MYIVEERVQSNMRISIWHSKCWIRERALYSTRLSLQVIIPLHVSPKRWQAWDPPNAASVQEWGQLEGFIILAGLLQTGFHSYFLLCKLHLTGNE
jgi:hypothetical protein